MSKLSTRSAKWLRRLSWVPRWAVVPTIHKQSVAEHSFHVICLCRWLLPLHVRSNDGNFELEVLRRAMEHDADEAQSGDIPSPYKNGGIDFKDQVGIVVKVADKLEALLFIYEEQLLGNRFGMEAVEHDVLERLKKVWGAFEYKPDLVKPSPRDLFDSAKLIAFTPRYPHPAMEGEPYEY